MTSNNDVFEKIKDRLSIVDIIEEYTPVIQRGDRLVCLCPFHQEKTPSMSISQEKGVYYCFGCGASGNIFTFVSNMENLDTKGALERLAQKANVDLKTPNYQKDQELEAGHSMLELAKNLFAGLLTKALKEGDSEIAQYIFKRKLTSETVSSFELGYSPKGNYLLRLIKEKGLDQKLALKVGLLVEKDGIIRDKFSDRLMVPILDEKSRIVGFTGRSLPNDPNPERPKYLNSGESKFFNKSNILYGLSLHKNQIQKSCKLILVEGNMDVIVAHQYGLTQCLASQGTAVTATHITNLKKLKVPVYLGFDNDKAGRIAEKKAFQMLIEAGVDCFKVIFDQKYKDLDEFLQENQKEKLLTTPYLDYLIYTNGELDSPDIYAQKAVIVEILSLVSKGPKIIQEHALNLLSKKTGLSVDSLSEFKPQTNSKVIEDEQNQVRAKTKNPQKASKLLKDFLVIVHLVNSLKDQSLQELYRVLNSIDSQTFDGSSLAAFISQDYESGMLEIISKTYPKNPINEDSQKIANSELSRFSDNLKNYLLNNNKKNLHLVTKELTTLDSIVKKLK
jgi:DNA primase